MLGIVSTYVFSVRRDALFWHLDGVQALQLIETQHDWLQSAGSVGLDPYRGPGNLFSPTNFRLLPVFLFQELFLEGRVGRVITFVFYNCQNFLLLCLLSYRLKLPSTVGILSGWFLALLVTPLIWTDHTTLLFPVHSLTPYSFELLTFVVLFFVLFVEIGRFGTIGSVLLIVFSVGLSLWITAACPLLIFLVVPFLVVLIVTSTILARAQERSWKLAALVIVCGALWLSGAFAYAYGFLKASPTSFFGPEIETYQSGLWWSSIAYQYDRFPAGLVVVTISFLAAFVVVARTIFKSARPHLLCASLVHCVCVAGMLLGWPFLERLPVLHDQLRHLRLFYFELAMLPFYVLFSALPVVAMTKLKTYPTSGPVRLGDVFIFALVALLVLPAARDVRRNNPYRQPVQPTKITEYLQATIGLKPSSIFRGRVVTVFPPAPDRQVASWDSMIATDISLYDRASNDLRFAGLWAFGIPTLQEYSQIITPGIYFWITRAMSSSDDKQDMRNHAMITRLDFPLLTILGTRFVISPQPIMGKTPLELVLQDGGYNLYELRLANIGQYFATDVVRVRDFPQMFQAIRRTDDLLEKTFIFEDVPSELLPASVEIHMERSAITVKGKSRGTSLVVLPFTYSHCYAIPKATESKGLQLVRVDLNMLGVLFTNEVNASLEMSTGLLNRSNCVLMDMGDYERLGLVRTARTIPRGGLISRSGHANRDPRTR